MEEAYRVRYFPKEWKRRTKLISSKENEEGVQSPFVPKRMKEGYRVFKSWKMCTCRVSKRMKEAYRDH
jgi:hypothetical protein